MNKDEVRQLFPEVIKFADACRDVFGNGVKLVYASENGRVVGKQSDIDPDCVVKLSDMEFLSLPVTKGEGRRGR